MLNLGKVVRSDIKPGLHFKVPLVEEVRKFDRRLLTLGRQSRALPDRPRRRTSRSTSSSSGGSRTSPRFYRATSGGDEKAAQQRLTPIVKNALRNEINQLHACRKWCPATAPT